MSEYKIAGHCTLCNSECFNIIERNSADERRPGEPKRIGLPHDGTTRITFMLIDGARMDLTFCATCTASVGASSYPGIWQRVIRSWVREFEEKGTPESDRPEWFNKQFENGMLSEMSRVLTKELSG